MSSSPALAKRQPQGDPTPDIATPTTPSWRTAQWTQGDHAWEVEWGSLLPAAGAWSPSWGQWSSPSSEEWQPHWKQQWWQQQKAREQVHKIAASNEDSTDPGDSSDDDDIHYESLSPLQWTTTLLDDMLPSVGSKGHATNECKRCAFFPKGRCRNGASCEHCHFPHEDRAKDRRKRRSRRKGAVQDQALGETPVAANEAETAVQTSEQGGIAENPFSAVFGEFPVKECAVQPPHVSNHTLLPGPSEVNGESDLSFFSSPPPGLGPFPQSPAWRPPPGLSQVA